MDKAGPCVKKKRNTIPSKGRQTAGKIATDLMQKELETACPVEQGTEMTKSYVKELERTLKEGISTWSSDFFIVVLTKKERLLQNIIRNYFFYRRTCPTPDYDQAVYHYKREGNRVRFLWVIPARDMCFKLKANAATLADEYKELLGYILDFADGTLYKKACILNNEDILEGSVVLREEINETEKQRTGKPASC